MTFNELNSILIHQLKQPLPGIDAHSQLMPAGRKSKYDVDSGLPAPKQSAVAVVCCLDEKSMPSILFTKRNEKLKNHAGQISFPGGRFNASEETFTQAALRECFEETGISINENMVIGSLSDLYIPPSNFEVFPVVVMYPGCPVFRLQQSEVEEAFLLPINILLKTQVKERKIQLSQGISIHAKAYDVNDRIIWGATGMILTELLHIIKHSRSFL
jgi:8-oxo-dGTP pyrophosphatase MutT (NUDIX family)